MKWQGILILISLVGALLGIAALIRPLPRIWLSTRRRAGFVLAASLVIGAMGAVSVSRRHCDCRPPIDIEKLYQRLRGEQPFPHE